MSNGNSFLDDLQKSIAKISQVAFISPQTMDDLCEINLTKSLEDKLNSITFIVHPFVEEDRMFFLNDTNMKKDMLFGNLKTTTFKEYKECYMKLNNSTYTTYE